jgi:hypothetical protein
MVRRNPARVVPLMNACACDPGSTQLWILGEKLVSDVEFIALFCGLNGNVVAGSCAFFLRHQILRFVVESLLGICSIIMNY